jgi:hypothetical protein
MSVIDPNLIFGNWLTYNAEEIIPKFNFPSIAKKMTDRLNQLVLVRETLNPDGSAFGTLYYTGSIVGFTYENLVNPEKVEDMSLIATEVAESVRRISSLIKQGKGKGKEEELIQETNSLKEKLQQNNSSTTSSLDNLAEDLNTLNDSFRQLNSRLSTYTSEAQFYIDLIQKINQIASSSLNTTLNQGSYFLDIKTNPNYEDLTFTETLQPLSVTLFPTSSLPLTLSPLTTSTTSSNALTSSNASECPPDGEKGIQDFQNWLDDNINTTKWNNKKKLNKDAKNGYGKCDDKTKKAWKDFSKTYLAQKNQPPKIDPKTSPNSPLVQTLSTSECPGNGYLGNDGVFVNDIAGIKQFQDWLDGKKYVWTKSGKPLNKDIKNGYGLCSDQTKLAWKKYNIEYLNSLYPENPLPFTENTSSVSTLVTSSTNEESLLASNIQVTSSLPSPVVNVYDEKIITVYKSSPSSIVQTTISSQILTPTTINFSRNRDYLLQSIQGNSYNASLDISDLVEYINQNKLKKVTIINLWGFPKENLATVSLKGTVYDDKNQPLENVKVKFKPALNAANRARLEQFINNSGLGGVLLQGSQSIQDIITSYNNVTGSISQFFSTGSISGSLSGSVLSNNTPQ